MIVNYENLSLNESKKRLNYIKSNQCGQIEFNFMFVSYPISTAPMLDYSDAHCRYFWRLFSPNALLYTEMIHANAILLGKYRNNLLHYDVAEHPLALQLGGNDPIALSECAVIAEALGYDEVNLNIGCPSDRVQSGQFGACLMRHPELVAACVEAMSSKVRIPITVKTRLGVDQDDSYEFLRNFISIVSQAGCHTFIIHARKAWLKGLSPKQNRHIPPLMYERVYQLKWDFPHLNFILNGGVKTLSEVQAHLDQLEGVMIGREAYDNPYFLTEIENIIFQNETMLSREVILEKYLQYVEIKNQEGVSMKTLLRPLMGLYFGRANAKYWRRMLSLPTIDLMTLRSSFNTID